MISKNGSYNNEDYFSTEYLKLDLKNRAVRGAGAVVSSRFLSHCIRIAGIIILARLLTPSDFGLVAMVTSISGFFFIYSRLGLTDATIQRPEINHRQISTLFWINLAFGLAITLLFMCLSPIVAWFFGEPRLKLIAIVSSLGFLFAGLSTQHSALLKRNMQFFKLSINAVGSTTISTIMAIALALYGCGYWAVVARPLIYGFVMAIGDWVFCKWRPGLPASGTGVRSMLKFGFNILGNYSVSYFSRNIDKTLIGWCYGAQSLGFYHKAFHLSVAPTSELTIPLTSVAVSTLSRLRDNPEKYFSYYLNAISMLAFVAMPLSAFLTVMSKDLILMLLGPQWNESAEIFSVFGFSIGIHILYATHGWLHISLGRTDRWFRWGILGSAAIILSFFIGLPFGAIGVAVSYTLTLHILIGPGLSYAGKPINLKFSSIFKVIWKFYLAALGAGLLYWFVLYHFELTSHILMNLNIFCRFLLSLICFVFIYLIMIVSLFRNIKPIKQFISILCDMLPSGMLKKQKNRHAKQQ